MRDYNSDDQLFLTNNYEKNDEYVFASMYDNPLVAANIDTESIYLDSTYIPPTEISSFDNQCVATSIDLWDDGTIMNWIIDTYDKANKDYETCNLNKFQSLTGSKLKNWDLKKFLEADAQDGKWLYGKVQELFQQETYPASYYTFQSESYVNSREFETKEEAEPVKIKRQRGRPKLSNKIRKKSEHRTGKLWEFIRDLLHNPKYCPALIMWEDHTNGIFRFVSSDKVAKLWGSMRGNDLMNYEKLSRAMRYYYKTEVFQPVLGKRLVYSFGKKAKGWQTSNPNFESNNL